MGAGTPNPGCTPPNSTPLSTLEQTDHQDSAWMGRYSPMWVWGLGTSRIVLNKYRFLAQTTGLEGGMAHPRQSSSRGHPIWGPQPLRPQLQPPGLVDWGPLLAWEGRGEVGWPGSGTVVGNPPHPHVPPVMFLARTLPLHVGKPLGLAPTPKTCS